MCLQINELANDALHACENMNMRLMKDHGVMVDALVIMQ